MTKPYLKKDSFYISLFDICYNIFNCFFSKSLKSEEKFRVMIKRIGGYSIDFFWILRKILDMKICLALGFVAGPWAIILSFICGSIFGYAGQKLNNNINKEKEFLFYTD